MITLLYILVSLIWLGGYTGLAQAYSDRETLGKPIDSGPWAYHIVIVFWPFSCAFLSTYQLFYSGTMAEVDSEAE